MRTLIRGWDFGRLRWSGPGWSRRTPGRAGGCGCAVCMSGAGGDEVGGARAERGCGCMCACMCGCTSIYNNCDSGVVSSVVALVCNTSSNQGLLSSHYSLIAIATISLTIAHICMLVRVCKVYAATTTTHPLAYARTHTQARVSMSIHTHP